MLKFFTPRVIAEAALVAALYVAITLIAAPISYGAVQMRISEALTLLPVFSVASIPGLFVGCLLSNLLGGAPIWDIIFGSLATLAAALMTRRLRAYPVLASIPPVIVNAVVVGLVLYYTANLPLWSSMLTVGAGQLVSCCVLGLGLLRLLRPVQARIWPVPNQ